jgi:ribosome maturation factor RimP
LKQALTTQIYYLIYPWLEGLGYRCLGVEWQKPELTVYIERQDKQNVGIDDCVTATRALLDQETVLDPLIDGAYELVVSSPGDEPPIMSIDHWQSAVGQQVQVELFEKVGLCKKSKGRLLAIENEEIHIQTPRGDWIFPHSAVNRANRLSEGSK